MKLLILLFLYSLTSLSSASDNKISYTDTGIRTGKPVVFMHAFPLNKTMWDDQVAALAKTNRVITFDVRGLGKSESRYPYTLEFIVDDLIELLDRLKIEKTVVCGLSMGGFVALRAIERNPERFSGAVLADTKSEPDSDSSKLGRYQAIKDIQTLGLSKFADGFIERSVSPVVRTKKPEIVERIKKLARLNQAAGVEAALLALVSRTDTTADLGKVSIPTLIIQGEHDTIIPIASAKALNEKIKGSEFFLVPNAGHLSNLENPAAFNSRLQQFLKDLK